MSFLLATLNPGRTRRRRRHGRRRRNPFLTTTAAQGAFMPNARRGRGRRRKLTAWQRAVKKYGGVMEAVRARRGGKKRKRRSVVSRRRLRSRSRKTHRRRPKMARVRRRRHRRHRMPSRGRGGRFVSRRHRRRKHRRNPVVPSTWYGNPGRRRRRRRRRNPLFLSRRGFSSRKHKGYRRLRRRRQHPRYWHNPVLPTFAFNPRRRRHHSRRRHHGRRRSYRRNPVLPIFAFNPGGGGDILGSVMSRAKSLIDVSFWTDTGVPAAVGFFGSKALGGMLHQYTLTQFAGIAPTSPYYPYTKALCDTLSGAGLSWAAGRFYNRKAGDAIWLGTVVNVAYTLLKSLFGSTSFGQMIGLSGMGDDMSDRMKDAVVSRVRANLGAYLTKGALRTNLTRALNGGTGVGSYATQRNLRSAYDPSPRGLVSDYDVTNTDTTL
jgi:hypothetical protein